MAKKLSIIEVGAVDSFPLTEIMDSNPFFTRREMLGVTGMDRLATLKCIAPGAVAQAVQKRPRIAVLVNYLAFTKSHADWIVTKQLDGYWWDDAYSPSRVELVSVYIHQLEARGLGQKICKSKNIPFETVSTVSEEIKESPTLNIQYRTIRTAQFNKGKRPPARPYIRGFDQ